MSRAHDFWESYCQWLLACKEGLACDDSLSPPWEKDLLASGVNEELYKEASYVLAALSDENRNSDDGSWQSEGHSWSWELFRDHAAGVNYYLRMESCAAEYKNLYAMGLLAGFVGRFLGEGANRAEWMDRYASTLQTPSWGYVCHAPQSRSGHGVIAWWAIVSLLLGGICWGLL